MTNDLEKQFFSTFGIKPLWHRYLLVDLTTRYKKEKLLSKDEFIKFVKSGKDYLFLKVVPYYRQITDRIYLELICIQNKFSHPYNFYGETLGFLKNDILGLFIETEEFFRENELTVHESFKSEVRTLFEEG